MLTMAIKKKIDLLSLNCLNCPTSKTYVNVVNEENIDVGPVPTYKVEATQRTAIAHFSIWLMMIRIDIVLLQEFDRRSM